MQMYARVASQIFSSHMNNNALTSLSLQKVVSGGGVAKSTGRRLSQEIPFSHTAFDFIFTYTIGLHTIDMTGSVIGLDLIELTR